MRRRILSENVSDEKIFLFFALLGNSIPHLVRLSGQRRMTVQSAGEPFHVAIYPLWSRNVVL